jgi:hypothetical protein
MADFQLSSFNIINADIPLKNYSTTLTIVAGAAVKPDTANPPSGSNPGGIVVTTSDVGAIGLTVEELPPGGVGRVRLLGGANAFDTTENLTYGDLVMGAAAGKIAKLTAGERQLGWVLNSSTMGDPNVVWLAPANNA